MKTRKDTRKNLGYYKILMRVINILFFMVQEPLVEQGILNIKLHINTQTHNTR